MEKSKTAVTKVGFGTQKVSVGRQTNPRVESRGKVRKGRRKQGEKLEIVAQRQAAAEQTHIT